MSRAGAYGAIAVVVALLGCGKVVGDDPEQDATTDDAAGAMDSTAVDASEGDAGGEVSSDGGSETDAAVDATVALLKIPRAEAVDLVIDGDGGYVLAGYRQELAGASSKTVATIWKVDAKGGPVWSSLVPNFTPFRIARASDGGFVAAGCFDSDDTLPYCKALALVRLAADGSTLWTRRFAETTSGATQRLGAVALGPDGSIYVTGHCEGALAIDGLPPTREDGSLFVAAWNADGTARWAKGYPSPKGTGTFGSFGASGGAIAWDAVHGVLVVGGSAFGALDLGDGAVVSPPSVEGGTAWVATFDRDGAMGWTKHFSADGPPGIGSVAIGADGTLFLVGDFGVFMKFDGDHLDCPRGGGDFPQSCAFVAALDPSTHVTRWKSLWSGGDLGSANRVRLNDSGDVVALGEQMVWTTRWNYFARAERHAPSDGKLLGTWRGDDLGDGRECGAIAPSGKLVVAETCGSMDPSPCNGQLWIVEAKGL